MSKRLSHEKAITRTKEKYRIKEKLAEQDGCKCYYCDKPYTLQQLTLDHIFPISKTNKKKDRLSIGNLVLSCPQCNVIKGNRIISIEEFRKERMGDAYYEISYKLPPKPKKIRKSKHEFASSFLFN